MRDEYKTKKQLITELIDLRQQIAHMKDAKKLQQTLTTVPNNQQDAIAIIDLKIQPVNEHQQTKQTLQEQEQYHFLQRLIDTIPNPIFYKDTEGLFQGCNAAYEKYIGMTKEDIVGKSVYEVYPSDLADIYFEKDSALFCKPGVQVYETSFRTADGTRRNVVFNKATYTSTNGTLAGLVGVIVDITERKRAEEALKTERQRLFSLLDALPAIVYLLAPDYSIPFSNLKFWERYGRPGNSTCYEIFKKQKKPCAICPTFSLFKTNSPLKKIVEFDGLIYEDYSFPFSDIDGSPLVLKLCIDITGHKKMEEKLRRSEQEKDLILSAISDNVILFDTEMRIVWTNKSAEQTLEAMPEQLVGHYCYEFKRKCSNHCPDCYTKKALDTGKFQEGELSTPDGRVFFMRSYPVKNDKDDVVGIVEVSQNITGRKQIEQEMARLERLNLIGEMAAGIGHEIRNPMTTVRGFLQILSRKGENPGHKEYFNLMIEELDRANAIITEFLSLAKNKAVHLKAQNLNNIIKAIFPLIQADAMRNDNYISMELGNITDLFLDEKEIRQLVLNLVRNGLEVMSTGGQLTITTFTEGAEVVLAVKDQGIGIKPDALKKLGTPFFTTKDNGTGLGLAVCYSIATRHNATINFDTSPKGTTFFVRFKQPCDIPLLTYPALD